MNSSNTRRLIGIARVFFGFSLLAALFYYVDPRLFVSSLAGVQLSWVLVAAVAITAATVLGAANLLLLFRPETGLTFHQFLPLYWISWAFGLIVPGQVGDMASIGLMLRRRGYPWHVV